MKTNETRLFFGYGYLDYRKSPPCQCVSGVFSLITKKVSL